LQNTSFANRQPDPAFQVSETVILSLTFAKLHQRPLVLSGWQQNHHFLDNLVLPNCQFILSFKCRLVSATNFWHFQETIANTPFGGQYYRRLIYPAAAPEAR
jgi:hypothetical protein